MSNPDRRAQTPTLRHRLRRAATAAAAGGALLLTALPAFAQSKIAVIEFNRAVVETERGRQVLAELRSHHDKRQSELDGTQRQLQIDKDALEKKAQAGKTPPAQLQKEAEALQKQWADFQGKVVEYDRDMQRQESEKLEPVRQGIREAVRRIASQEGYEMILEKQAVPYSRGDLDITDRAIQLYNSGQVGGVPATPTPPPTGKPAPGAPPAGSPAKPPAKGAAPPPAAPPAGKAPAAATKPPAKK